MGRKGVEDRSNNQSDTDRRNPGDMQRCHRLLQSLSGEFLRGKTLVYLLGYGSIRSYQLAAQRGALPPVRLYQIPGQKGRYARASELSEWLVSQPDWEKRITQLDKIHGSGSKRRSK